MSIQWFPGHMRKAQRLIDENIKLVDVVVELIDARIPYSSRNPDIDNLIGSHPRLIILNRADMADDIETKAWVKHFRMLGNNAIFIDSVSGRGMNTITTEINALLEDKRTAMHNKGIQRSSVRIMVVGIPNVGKSTFINKLAGRAAAKTGNRPGVTMAKQWIRLRDKYELLDMPGTLWPKFDDEAVGFNIAYTGGIKDEILDIEDVACHLIAYLSESYPANLTERYRIDVTDDSYDMLEAIGRKRGCVISGGNIDTERAAKIVLDDFRSTKLGRITLEKAEHFTK